MRYCMYPHIAWTTRLTRLVGTWKFYLYLIASATLAQLGPHILYVSHEEYILESNKIAIFYIVIFRRDIMTRESGTD